MDTPGTPVGSLPGEHPDAAGQRTAAEPSPEPGKRRRLLYVTLPGCWGALIAGCLSFTPSLLPRTGIIQGIVWGITGAIGYGVGVLAAQIWRSFPDRAPRRPQRRSWLIFFISAAVLTVVFFGLGQYWQYLIRGLMGVTEYNIALVVASPFVAALVFCVILLIGRGLRGLYHWVAHLLHRWMGQRAARAIGWGLVAGLTYVVVTGLLFDGFVNAMNSAYSLRDTKTAEGVHQPTTGLRSGGPGSVIPWNTLGWQGRNFIGKGPSVSDIEKATGHPAMEPIRIYSGLASASDAEARSALAVRDLERAGGFQRKYLLVVSTTGSGWVDPALSDSFEYLTGGDSAIVALQYSYLPSWISYLVDQSKAREAGRALFDAVYGRWSQLPQDKRPRLLVAGESLGSFGGESAFSGVNDIRNRTSGVLWVGPTNDNTLWTQFTADRDPGTPEWQPVYRGGNTVRFITSPSQLSPVPADWPEPRVVYLQNTSDPIVWWSWALAFHQPDWLRGTHPPDVSSAMHWYPLVTFWQVAADLALATAVPAGHGHTYGMLQGAASWAAIIPPAGWTADRTAELGNLAAN